MTRIEISSPENLSIGIRHTGLIKHSYRHSDYSYALFSVESQGIRFWVSEQIENDKDYGHYCSVTWQALKDTGQALDLYDKSLGIKVAPTTSKEE